MEPEITLEILAIFAIIIANGFFSLSEFSIIASRKSKLKQLMDENKSGARAAEKINRNPKKFLATMQVGITLMATLAGVFGGATLVIQLEKYLFELPVAFISNGARTISMALIAIIITFISVIIGELVPKYLALSNPEKYASIAARPALWFMKLTSFVATILSNISGAIIKMFGIKTDSEASTITEDEINLMIYEGKEKGVFDETEEKLIKSVFDFADSTVRRAMTPRTDVVAISLDDNFDKIIDTIIDNGYTRYPIFKNTIDNIIGILYTKDLITHKVNPDLIILKDLLRTPLFVPDSMMLSKLLKIFQNQKQHLAIVLDEFGGTAGIISLEDLIEELVGEIQDEYDSERAPLVKHSDTIAYADGNVWPGDVNELLNCQLPEDNIDTLAGLIINKLGKLPEKDEIIKINNIIISVLEKEDNRIVRLKIEIKDDNTSDNSYKKE